MQERESRLKDVGEMTFGKRKETLSQESARELSAAVDQRRRVNGNDIRRSPWRSICDLLITANGGTRHTGTGFFISPRTVLTAGHCLFIHNPGSVAHGLVREVLIMPARNGETNAAQSPFGWIRVRRNDLLVHTRWRSGDLDFDYGVMILPEEASEIGESVDRIEYGHFENADLDGSRPTLSGYPDDMPEGTQWFEVNTIKELTFRSVSYDIHTAAGQSGSPVFFPNDAGNVACAIHNWGDTLNRGVRINREVIDQLDEWRVD